jgi:hypothetical protein
MDSLEKRADVMAVEWQAVLLKPLAYALGADMRVLHYEAADALTMVMLSFSGQRWHGADGRFP